MAYMGQRPECGYKKMGADSYKSQNWFGQVNMTIVHECFCENSQKFFLNHTGFSF